MTDTITKIRELASASGAIRKQEILKAYKGDSEFCRLLYFFLNPLLTYKVSENTLSSLPTSETAEPFSDIFEACETLASRKAADDATLARVGKFLETQPESDREFYIQLLSKTLRLGVTAKSVNKAIPNLIPEWEVQQAYPIEKFPVKEGAWFTLTEKLNGVRATFYKGQLISRTGIPYTGLEHITKVFDDLELTDHYVFDGELTLYDKTELTDNEAFRIATGIVNSESDDKTAISYTVFDMLPIEDFENDNCIAGYRFRRTLLDLIAPNFAESCSHVRILPLLYEGTDLSAIDPLLDQMVAEDKEGLMLNLDVSYKRKRHNGILKIKRFYTMDLPIIRCEEGEGRLAGTLGAFTVSYKGNEVNVGSGFTDIQRAEYWANRENLVGTLCEVKYKEISKDKTTGAESLQFPVFVALRTDKYEANFE